MHCHSREVFSTINDLHGLVNRLEPSWHCVYSEPLPAAYPCSLQSLFESFSGLAGSEKRRDGGYYRGKAAKNGEGANLMFLTKRKIDLREPLENYILWSFLQLSLHPNQSRWLRQIFTWLIQNRQFLCISLFSIRVFFQWISDNMSNFGGIWNQIWGAVYREDYYIKVYKQK